MKISEIFSGSDNTSYGRILSAVAAVFLFIWVSVLFYKVYSMQTFTLADLKNSVPDIPVGWVTLIVAPYGITKSLQVAGTIFGTKP
jgi:hypothetical protein